MAALASSDVTVTEVHARRTGGTKSRTVRLVTLAFGDGALTYPTGGVPLDKGALGCPTEVTALRVVGRTAAAALENPVWEWNGSATEPKLLALVAPADAADKPLSQSANTYAPAAQSLKVEVEGY